MPATYRLPKGCAASRGTSDVPHITAIGGGRAHVTNRLYMLTVRRESLVNKRKAVKQRLADIDQQIKQMGEDIRATEQAYGQFKGRRTRGNGAAREAGKPVNGRLSLEF